MTKDNRIFKGLREIHISKAKYQNDAMYILWKKSRNSKKILGNLIITRSIMDLVLDRFRKQISKKGSKTPDFDKILIETVVDTLNHENMHLAIYDTEGMHTSMLYDLLIGGSIRNDSGILSSGGSSIQYRKRVRYKTYLP